MATSHIKLLEALPQHAVPDGIMRRAHGEQLTVLWGERGKGSSTPLHSHPHEQMLWLISGEIEALIGDDPPRRLSPNQVVVIPGGVPHEFRYLERSTLIEMFAPGREDLYPGGRYRGEPIEVINRP
jgi:quercetin dioxygenase-like cupin family protein